METLAPPTLRQEHERLRIQIQHIRAAARELPDLSPDERSLLVARVVEFLRGTLLPMRRPRSGGSTPRFAEF